MYRLIVIIALLFSLRGVAAPPNWTVQIHKFEFSMTMIGTVEVDHIFMTQKDDMIAAFVGDECRGVSKIYVSSEKHVAYMIVYGNISYDDPDKVHFKVYDSNSDRVVDMNNLIDFKINGIFGSTPNPYLWSNTEQATSSEDNSFILEAFPNPSVHEVHIKLKNIEKKNVSVTLFNSEGIEMKRSSIDYWNDNITIDVSWLPSGVYIIVLETLGFIDKRKIIVQRK
ncbi:T9SS type A sorting domain-containing protein [Halosquirtibacter laminarini]|uniref:T9SS type A sorting domain-containing protein n=1 Tax=Halosquirtibacter laminarini TaxID=3374600 RepID=A0AC61NJM7_9BACT|nr:T9SS type A sorting domain-containing protein [Prolixibacteraceae bacterium]